LKSEKKNTNKTKTHQVERTATKNEDRRREKKRLIERKLKLNRALQIKRKSEFQRARGGHSETKNSKGKCDIHKQDIRVERRYKVGGHSPANPREKGFV